MAVVEGAYELTATADSIVSEGIGTPGLDSYSAVGRYVAGAFLRSTFGSVKPYRMETKAMDVERNREVNRSGAQP
jgi:hypothetical protein